MLLKKVKACAETLKTTLLPDTRWTKCLVGGQGNTQKTRSRPGWYPGRDALESLETSCYRGRWRVGH